MNKLDEKTKTLEDKLPELEAKAASLPAPTGPDPALVQAEQAATGKYLAALTTMYAAEREAGIQAPPAPGDPSAPKSAAAGARVHLDAVILGVNKVGDRTQVRFARGNGTDPAAWKDEALADAEGEFTLAPGTVASLEAVIQAGQEPAWRIVKATERK